MKTKLTILALMILMSFAAYAETVEVDGIVNRLDPDITATTSYTSGGDTVTGTVERPDAMTGELSASNEVEFEVTKPELPAGYNLTDAAGNPIGNVTGNLTLQIRDLGERKVEFEINDDADLSQVTVDSDEKDTVVFNLTESSGVTGTHSLFIPYDAQAGVFVCPDAAILSEVVVGCSNMGSFTHSECSGSTTKSISGQSITCSIDGTDYKVSGLTGSGIGAQCDHCNDCDEGLYCELRNSTPTCQDRSVENPPQCVDCLDNDGDTYYDVDGFTEAAPGDPGCVDYEDDNEVDPAGEPGVIPEFSTVGIILAMIIIALGIMVIRKRR